MAAKYLAVKNFDDHQHYKTGKHAAKRPTWIKLYLALLDDFEFLSLPEAARGQLMLLWLMAGAHRNRIPNDEGYIRGKLRSRKLFLAEFLAGGWLMETDEPPRQALAPSTHHAPDDPGECLDGAYTPSMPEVEREERREEPTHPARARDPESSRSLEEVVALHGPEARNKLVALRALVPDAHWPDVEAFLRSRRASTWGNWCGEMAKLIGPGSQFLPADLAGACAEALCLESPLGGPGPLKDFVAKRRRSRLEEARGDAPRASARPSQRETIDETYATALAVGRALLPQSGGPTDADS